MALMAKKTQTPPKSFEEGLSELETLVEQMESGEVSLEEALAKHERGMFLSQWCRGVLDSAEKQIEVLAKGGDGSVEVVGEMPPESRKQDE